MPIVRKRLAPSEVYPDDMRYDEATDTVQSFVNGSWVDNPEADPRTQTTFPPRLTADPACDAAQSVMEAIHGQIDGVIEAIDNASTLFTIAGIILSIFTFGAYALFISLALGIGDQMLGFGTAAITAALTEPVYETFRCILYCHMTNQGRINEGELGTVQAEITDQIGGIGATILNAMLSLAGEGGVNNLASLGAATGDCSLCDCPETWCYRFDFTLAEQGWVINTDGYTFGKYTSTVGFQQADDYTPADALELQSPTISRVLTNIKMFFDPDFTGSNPQIILYRDGYVEDIFIGAFSGALFSHDIEDGLTYTTINFDADPQAGGQQFWGGALVAIELSGIGENPFGTDNCL